MTLTFEQKMQNYAKLAVKVGVNLQAGQHLMINANLEAAPMVRLVTVEAYQAGARLVDVLWSDDALILARFKHAPRDSFTEFSEWRIKGALHAAKRGDAFLSIRATDPDLLKGQDPELVSTYIQTLQKNSQPVSNYVMKDAINWSVIATPTPDWAAKVFPNTLPKEQVDRLWDAIFSNCRLNQPDPISAWQEHIKTLKLKSNYLNAKQYTALKYKGPGTNLTVGLPKNQIWKSARSKSDAGILFTANIPTEEVFTMPHKDRVDGVVSASKPLIYASSLIEDFSLTFVNGRVVKATARQGDAILQNLLKTDEGAAQLGEVALVPHSSPISQSGLLFFNTLYDENAASHLAIGQAYRFCVEGGTTMSKEQFAAVGGNNSLVHSDFMIGCAEMDVDGVTEDGSLEPVMRQGEWAF